MNKLLAINQDSDIINVVADTLVSPEDVDSFLTGMSAPSLEPFLVYWDQVTNPWNAQLAATFADNFTQKRPLANEDRDDVAAYFIQRVETLRKILLSSIPRDGESEEAVWTRLSSKRQHTLKITRVRGRQSRVS